MKTRMHSSRMRTVRNSSGLLAGGGAWSVGGGGVSALEGCLVLGGGIPACTETDPPVNRMTDRCKNITLATSLRTVIITFCVFF